MAKQLFAIISSCVASIVDDGEGHDNNNRERSMEIAIFQPKMPWGKPFRQLLSAGNQVRRRYAGSLYMKCLTTRLTSASASCQLVPQGSEQP